jgi:phage-related protein
LKFFETLFLEEVEFFLDSLDSKTVSKIIYLIDLAEHTNDPKLFKKINKDIWEFRIQYFGLQVRLLAFWDNSKEKKSLVVATHGFIKKNNKVPNREIKKAEKIKKVYLAHKNQS